MPRNQQKPERFVRHRSGRNAETDEIDAHVGQRVRLLRISQGMSQAALAGALGLTFQQIQKYESGINRLSASRLVQISRILDVPVAFFFEGLDQGKADFPEGTLDVVGAWARLDKDNRRNILAMMRAVPGAEVRF